MIVSMLSQISIAAFAGLVLWAAASDMRRFIIPNRVAAAIAVLWIAHAGLRWTAGAPAVDLVFALALGIGAFALGVVLFMMRLAGGGDVKLFAAIALWAGPAHAAVFLTLTLFAGGIVALAYLSVRTLRAMTTAPMAGIAPAGFGPALAVALKSQVPFGIAIAAGGLFVAVRLFFGPSI
jgi:prepilin peptidase CpaA